MSGSNARNNHLHGPKASKYTDHQLEIREVANCHHYECRCVTCGNCHVKWSKQSEYLWYQYRTEEGLTTSFRQMYWAPTYDPVYTVVEQAIREDEARYNQADKDRIEFDNRFYEKHKD